jgi:SPP1 gp7 family putative phage head morphogenesis protein
LDVSSLKLGGAPTRGTAPSLTTDLTIKRETRKQREFFSKVRRSETAYAVNLRKIATQIGHLIGAFDPQDAEQVRALEHALRHYANVVRPWARAVARRMLADVQRRDEKVWREYSAFMGLQLQQEIASAPTGEALWQLMNEQVELITSLPLDAAQRVHELAVGSLYTGARAKEISTEILKTGDVTRARANLIARTEVGRAATTLTKVRAEHVGSTHYRWVSSHDYDVRKRHKHLDGTVHAWNDPPVASEPGQREMRYHPGSGPNCRCWAYPILPEEKIANVTNWHAGREE